MHGNGIVVIAMQRVAQIAAVCDVFDPLCVL